jgi:hypothetical protein
MPLLPPVTIATLPSMLIFMMVVSFGATGVGRGRNFVGEACRVNRSDGRGC